MGFGSEVVDEAGNGEGEEVTFQKRMGVGRVAHERPCARGLNEAGHLGLVRLDLGIASVSPYQRRSVFASALVGDV